MRTKIKICGLTRASDAVAAVEAGANAANQVGELVSSHVIARPAEGLMDHYLR